MVDFSGVSFGLDGVRAALWELFDYDWVAWLIGFPLIFALVSLLVRVAREIIDDYIHETTRERVPTRTQRREYEVLESRQAAIPGQADESEVAVEQPKEPEFHQKVARGRA